MTLEEFRDIFSNDDADWEGDNAYQGLHIIAKYFDSEKSIITGAERSVIYSVAIEELIEQKITEEDAMKLRKLNWMINDGDLACFV